MLAIKHIRQDIEKIRQGLLNRGSDISSLERVAKLDEDLRARIVEVETSKAERNRVTQDIATLKKAGESAEDKIAAMSQLSKRIKEMEGDIQGLQETIHEQSLWIPNVPHDSVPTGSDSSANEVIDVIGEPQPMAPDGKDHLELLSALELVDFKAGARIAGRGFPLYTGRGARLERALINFMLNLHTSAHGYTEIYPPFMATRKATEVAGQLPKLEEDMYLATIDDLFLIPTAEVPITNIHQGQILSEADLPLKYVAFSACFRREAGSYGKETKGLLRVHQFNKVELVKFVHPNVSYDELETLRSDAETVLQQLNLTYRVVELCTGDLSFHASKCYDLEVYAPVTDQWLEVSSCSNFESFQALRGDIRFRRKDTGKLDHIHTLNGSGVATPRLLVALIETFQRADGSIVLPEALVPYYGEEIIGPA
jgi:seryl-tRNA synthetase